MLVVGARERTPFPSVCRDVCIDGCPPRADGRVVSLTRTTARLASINFRALPDLLSFLRGRLSCRVIFFVIVFRSTRLLTHSSQTTSPTRPTRTIRWCAPLLSSPLPYLTFPSRWPTGNPSTASSSRPTHRSAMPPSATTQRAARPLQRRLQTATTTVPLGFVYRVAPLPCWVARSWVRSLCCKALPVLQARSSRPCLKL